MVICICELSLMGKDTRSQGHTFLCPLYSFSGGSRTEAIYVYWGIRILLAIVIFPKLFKLYFDQFEAISRTFSLIFLKLLPKFSSLLSTSKPKIVKLSVHCRPRLSHRLSFGSKFPQMGMTLVLSILQWTPLRLHNFRDWKWTLLGKLRFHPRKSHICF